MSAEIGDWLAEVCTAEPVAAAELGAGLVVLAEAAKLPGQPLVTDVTAELAYSSADDDLRYRVDHAYQDLLAALQQVRQEAAEAASYRTMHHQRFRHFGDGRPDVIEELPLTEDELAAARNREEELTARSQRLHRDVDAFRTAKETAKAMYTAAEASLRVHEAIAAAESDSARSGALAGATAAGPGSAAQREDEELAGLNLALGAAEARLRTALTAACKTLREIRAPDTPGGMHTGAADDDPAAQAAADGTPVPGLLELRADPLGADIRILFAVEPPGTVTFLAVLDGADAISDHRDEAIELAGQLLTDIRDGSWPPAGTGSTGNGEVCFDDPATLLVTFFPDHGAAVRARAAELAVLGTLVRLRRDRELSIAAVATASGLPEHRVWEIEHAGLRAAGLHEAAAYVRALGGRLDLTAAFGPAARTGLS